MSTILVTGAAGFIGSYVTKALLARGDVVIGVDDFNDYYNITLKEKRVKPFQANTNFTLYRDDIRDHNAMKKVFAKHSIDKICHLAARAGVRPSVQYPKLYVETNILGTENIFECAREFTIPHVVFASSASVYGNSSAVPYKESDPVDHPISPYAATKKTCELLAYTYHHLYGLRCIGLRFFTAYGPAGRPDMAYFLFADALRTGKPIQVFNHGKLRRDFTYIDDIANGVIRAIDADHLGYEIINLGHSKPVELGYFIECLEKEMGASGKKVMCDMQPGDVLQTYADVTKAKDLLGWEPHTPIEEGLHRFVQWYTAEYTAS